MACWTAIAEYFALHTVAKVVEATQTGYQNRVQEEWIDEECLRAAFGHIADITEEQRAAFNIAHQHPSLNAGDKDFHESKREWLSPHGDSSARKHVTGYALTLQEILVRRPQQALQSAIFQYTISLNNLFYLFDQRYQRCSGQLPQLPA